MTDSHFSENDFLNKLAEIIEANLQNEKFGVSELVREHGMSRSYIHRRLKASANQSISQFICTMRLKKAMEMLRGNMATSAEIAYQVGFSSPAYFSRCFHEQYGFPPGEVKKRNFEIVSDENEIAKENIVETWKYSKDNRASTATSRKSTYLKIILATVFFFSSGC